MDQHTLAGNPVYIDDRIQVLNHCDTFAILNRWGNIAPGGKGVQGIYSRDTRFINTLQLTLNDQMPELLSSNLKEENDILSVDLTNPELNLPDGQLLIPGTIHLERSQFVQEDSFHEKLVIQSFHTEPITLNIALHFDSDFKDIFEVRGLERSQRGMPQPKAFKDLRQISLSYVGLDQVKRSSVIEFSTTFREYSPKGVVHFSIQLLPRKPEVFDYTISLIQNSGNARPFVGYDKELAQLEPVLHRNKSYFPVLETANEQFTHWLHRSRADLISLMADTPYGKYPYAGVPWYNTAFGRDGIISCLQTLWIAPELSRDALLFLSALQAQHLDPAADAEPGKILHETRQGEMVSLKEVPFKKYYGTVDATPLYVMLAGAYYDRTADLETIRHIWPNIKAALSWIDEYGDLDGDGFVEYQHKAHNGLTNQAWKDSFDSVFYENGQLADPPLALCEVQGYVYAAKLHASKLSKLFHEDDRAQQLAQEAEALKSAFNKAFWNEEINCFVLALDGEKRPCRVRSSNAGHLLFTGIADKALVPKLVNTLMQPDMFNGWGIRTISSKELRYNPMSYHNGSVWPHDVSLIAAGFARYGYKKEASRLTTGLFDASLFIPLQRLPELICGHDRRKAEGPTTYPVACSPQAWSVSAVFMLLDALLQIEVDPVRKEIRLQSPYLPDYLESITIKELQVDTHRARLEIQRQQNNNQVSVYWANQPDDWKLILVR